MLRLGLGIGLTYQSGGFSYSENGFNPGTVLDYGRDYFRADGAAVADPVDYGTLGLATLVDSTGTIVWNVKDGNGDWYGLGDTLPGSPTYLPRIGHHVYEGGEWVNAGLLTEPVQRTNLALYSGDFLDATWGKVNILTPTADGVIGGVAAWTIQNNGTTAQTRPDQVLAKGTGTEDYTISVLAAADAWDWVYLQIQDTTTTGNFLRQFFNVRTGALGSFSGNGAWTSLIDTFIVDVEDGYRVGFSFNNASSAGTAARCSLLITTADGVIAPTGDSGKGVRMTAMQFEAGSTPSSYIPTAGSTVTRAADPVPFLAPASLPVSGGMPAAVSIGMEGRMTYADEDLATQGIFIKWYDTSSNYIQNFWQTNATLTGRLAVTTQAGGVYDGVVSADDAYTPGVNVPFNIASRHGSTFINGAHEGTLLTEDTTPVALADLSTTNFQFAVTGDQIMTKVLRVWGEDIGDDGITTATGGTV